MNIYMQLGKKQDIAHCIFEEILVPQLKNEPEYAGKLKKCMQINFTNTIQNAFIKSGNWDWDSEVLLPQLANMNFKVAVIWFDGSWPYGEEFDDSLMAAVEEWGDDWLVAGHVMDRLERAEAPEFHKQCIVLNLAKYKELGFPEFEWNNPWFPGFEASEEHIHDNYTPLYLKPLGVRRFETLDFYGDQFDALIPIALSNGLMVHNLNYDIRNAKYCCYPEDDIEQTKMWLLDTEWGKRPDARDYYFDEVPEDKRELYGFKMMSEDIMYITNTESVPNEDELKVEVVAVPCSGLSQFKHMANTIDTLEKIIWFDFSPYATKWVKHVLDTWDGKDFKKFVDDNVSKLTEWGFHNHECLIYEPDSVDEFMDSFDSEEDWLEMWDKIRAKEHVVLQLDIVQDPDTLINTIGKDKIVFLQTSNIWSYEINYLNTKNFDAQASFLKLINELLTNSKELYFTGDTPAGFYHYYYNVKQLSGIL